jgi:ubiquinone/menaquinone biosynthesis C-methylase UbiE
MSSKTAAPNAATAVPGYHVVGRHGLMPEVTHDETARFNYLANLNRYLAGEIMPGVKRAYEHRAKPQFIASQHRAPTTRHEVRKLMERDSAYQNWSALRRMTMEQRQQAGRSVVLRQLQQLNEKAEMLNQSTHLQLDTNFKVPRYIAAVDQHCMPGGYVQELAVNDVSAAANYDVGIFATTGGGLGRFSDGGGWAVAEWLKTEHPEFKPKKILDLGCGLGHNTLPMAQAFPDAEVTAIDVAAPMLRYGHARAVSMGVHNVKFIQANAEAIPARAGEFDFVMTCMFLHETSYVAIYKIFAEIHRVLRPGGLSLHLEQPQYHNMDLYEQFIRDWDAYNNNEPFWTTMHDMDLREVASRGGFAIEQCFDTGLAAVVDESLFPKPKATQEDYGRKAAWYAFGARK